MDLLQALILGIVQGATEFFPVSSSAHLRLVKHLMGIADGEHLLYFDLLCHAGTLLALVLFLWRDCLAVLKSGKKIALFSLAIVPLVPAYFLLKPVRIALSDPSYLGIFLLITSALLFAAGKVSQKMTSADQKWQNVIWIGVIQAMALIPGISRSGSTIAMGRFCGWSWKEAARFSFLLAVPTILGGEFLETMKLMKGVAEAAPLSWGCYAGGFLASFLVGCGAVRAVFWIYEREKVAPFAWYCLGVGILALIVFHG